MGISLKLYRIVHNISLYKKIICFYSFCLSTLVAMATLNFCRLIMGKNENWHKFIAIALQIF